MMKNYKDTICDYYKVECDLRKKLVDEIREFVKTNGNKTDKGFELILDGMIDEFISMPVALMETDRRTDSYSWESITSIIVESDESETVLFDCEYGMTDSDYILIGDLTDLYETLLYIQEYIDDGEIVIEDGTITIKE